MRQVARSRGMGSDSLEDVAAKACAGRVGILLIDADRQVFGTMDRTTGRWQPACGMLRHLLQRLLLPAEDEPRPLPVEVERGGEVDRQREPLR